MTALASRHGRQCYLTSPGVSMRIEVIPTSNLSQPFTLETNAANVQWLHQKVRLLWCSTQYANHMALCCRLLSLAQFPNVWLWMITQSASTSICWYNGKHTHMQTIDAYNATLKEHLYQKPTHSWIPDVNNTCTAH